MIHQLEIGTLDTGGPFTLPADLGDKKIALLAQSKKGKTYGLGDILEELARAQRPFIASDPANNLWGLRVLPDGQPSALKVVVIGGDHADIPFEKDAGERLAEALLATPICVVIDVAFETPGHVRRFWTDFAGRLMRQKPEIPRVIVLEECPVLIPQNAFGVQAQLCKAAVSKLATIGGNFGYGVIPACQRPATMDKDVLSQCEALIVMGITHKQDRKTVKEWMEAKDIGERAAAAFAELGSLKPGEAWFWWPGEDRFEKFTFRKRITLHPREMQKLGLKASAVQLGDMQAFVERMKRELSKVQAVVCDMPKNPKTRDALGKMVEAAARGTPTPERRPGEPALAADAVETLRIEKAALEGNYRNQVDHLKAELDRERRARQAVERRLEAVRKHLLPDYQALQALFGEIGEAPGRPAAGEIGEVWEPWLKKAGTRGCRRVLETLIRSGRLKMRQLATLAGIQYGNRSWRDYKSWLVTNSLVTIEGDEIEAVEL